MQILQKNATESWNMALTFRNELWNGKATLANKKFFVSTLLNAIELFLKQYLINNNDHRVIYIVGSNSLKEEYENACDINNFLLSTFKDEQKAKSIRTITFNEIKEILLNDNEVIHSFSCFHSNITLLQKLRNKETHFYIDEDAFLTDTEFLEINNLMFEFWNFTNRESLLPFSNSNQVEVLTEFSYKDQLRNNSVVLNLKRIINNYLYSSIWGKDAEAITMNLGFLSDKIGVTNDLDLYSYIYMLLKYEMFTIVEEGEGDSLRHDYYINT